MTKKEMKEEIAELRNNGFTVSAMIEQQLKVALEKGEQLEKENAEAKNLIEELASSLSVVGECDEEECELINKAQKFINKPIF